MKKQFDVGVDICGVPWKNRIAAASGTYNFRESSRYYDPAEIGCITTKGVSPEPWAGNETPKVAETPGGMLNAIGLANRGLKGYLSHDLKPLKDAGATVMANVVGHTTEEYCAVAEGLADSDVDLLELNISCPNVKEGGIAFGTDPRTAAALVREVKKRSGRKPVLVKLSPNVTSITDIAKAVCDAGADGLSLINTLIGMRIDLKTGEPVLANGTGGLSGPAIHPVAIRMVYEVRKALPSIPIIGMGGVMTGADAYEFLLAGADAVAVGTAALLDPAAPPRIARELETILFDNRANGV
ncbi:MAG: dihydroorotate dehydrogenase [Clostridiales Family XIII bacterium]|jgi:dihydroorotate dehydrogenase (NAD+) catalytic subunit|nr:dihydroorotate dehydrogenase [Clostridiales Family XIII bacterium]